MYLIGKQFNDGRFKIIYGIFKDESRAKSYKKSIKEDLNIEKFDNLNFPFFLIEELEVTNHSYNLINKEGLKKRIEGIIQSNNSETIYFNLWKIDGDGYNKNYPKEPFLNGGDWHLHFMNQDIQKINKDGFDKYWNDLLKVKLL